MQYAIINLFANYKVILIYLLSQLELDTWQFQKVNCSTFKSLRGKKMIYKLHKYTEDMCSDVGTFLCGW